MKRLWRRHRTWFLAVLPGLVTAALLAWWFTPRPSLTVPLPEIPDGMEDLASYQVKDDDICARAIAKEFSWVPVELARESSASSPSTPEEEWIKTLQFVNVETGEVVAHPGLSAPVETSGSANLSEEIRAVLGATTINPLWFDANGRFLVERRTFVGNDIRQIDWFDPETKESRAITVAGSWTSGGGIEPVVPPTIEEGWVDGLPTQTVSPDGTAIIDVKETGEARVAVRIFDLGSKVWREQQLTLKDPSCAWDFYISPSADNVAFYRTDPAYTDVYDVSSGQRIDRAEGPIARLPGQWHSGTDSNFFRRYLLNEEQMLDTDGSTKLIVDGASRKTIVDSSGVVWRENHEPDLTASEMWQASVRDLSPALDPQLIPGQSWFVWATVGHCPGLLERWFQSFASAFGFSVPVEIPIGTKVVWINWRTNQRIVFRTESPDEDLGGTFAIRPNCVCLLVNPKGPNPRVEVWSTPPPQRPVLAICLASLAVTIAMWFWLRHRARPATSLENARASG